MRNFIYVLFASQKMDEKGVIMNSEKELIYVWDAYCGWCYGFSSTIRSLHENHPEWPLTILSGGLFVGDRSHSIAAFPHIPEANKRISQITGAKFGLAYQELLNEGSFVLDSESAAIGFYALRSLAPDRAMDLASAMQKAFYYDGLSLSAPQTYYKIAVDHHMDADRVMKLLSNQETVAEVHKEFDKVQRLGVNSYPTLLLRDGANFVSLGATMDIDELEKRLASTIVALPTKENQCAVDNKTGC
ncbi:DsbA family protein [Paenibacillus silvae]|uniref:DsbA family protein n=1 Tax=Paenibacillus silvae TaxID=1325358 RepID=UPI003CEE8A27